MAERLIVYGGSFDPVHNGHVQAVLWLAQKYPEALILVVPSAFTPPVAGSSRKQTLPFRDRFRLLRLALQGAPVNVKLSCLEGRRHGVSYTIDTLLFLRKTCNTSLSLVIGEDNLAGFPNWHRSEEISRLADLIVLRRDSVLPADQPIWPESSTEIRRMLSESRYREASECLPPRVFEEIRKRGMYSV